MRALRLWTLLLALVGCSADKVELRVGDASGDMDRAGADDLDIGDAPGVPRTNFEPSNAVASPTLLLDAPGLYEIELDVTDDAGRSSCTPATASVAAVPP
jgi:hypothetical protein